MNAYIISKKQTSTKSASARKAIKDLLSAPEKTTPFFTGEWLSISDNDIIEWFHEKTWLSPAELRSLCLDFISNKINHHAYGAGCHYELFESRRQETIAYALESLSKKISHHDLTLFKQHCDYNEEPESELACCDQCGCSVSAYDMACSMQYVGETLCANCCDLAMM